MSRRQWAVSQEFGSTALPLFLWSIATIVGVVLGLRGPRSAIVAAFCAGLGIALSFGMLSQPDVYSSGFATWFIASCGISFFGWIARLALAQRRAANK
jgi:hypothetical protein